MKKIIKNAHSQISQTGYINYEIFGAVFAEIELEEENDGMAKLIKEFVENLERCARKKHPNGTKVHTTQEGYNIEVRMFCPDCRTYYTRTPTHEEYTEYCEKFKRRYE